MGVSVRPLLRADRGSISRMLSACGAYTPDEVRVALELIDDALTRGAESDYLAFVAIRDDAVAGYVCLGRTALTQSTWHLYWICVDVRLQGTGIGGLLQSHAEVFVSTQGGRRIVLETSSQSSYDEARRFYERRGYQPAGRIPDFYKPDDDCIIYFRELPAV